ncbi:MAG: hypothetical protein E7189_10905 [Erysipelotrichaceae bacterium]|nr:hypothetical protein [Erysipelotrichaceae bacterium]
MNKPLAFYLENKQSIKYYQMYIDCYEVIESLLMKPTNFEYDLITRKSIDVFLNEKNGISLIDIVRFVTLGIKLAAITLDQVEFSDWWIILESYCSQDYKIITNHKTTAVSSED